MENAVNIKRENSEPRSGVILLVKKSNNSHPNLPGFQNYIPKREIRFLRNIQEFMYNSDVREAWVIYCEESEWEEAAKKLEF